MSVAKASSYCARCSRVFHIKSYTNQNYSPIRDRKLASFSEHTRKELKKSAGRNKSIKDYHRICAGCDLKNPMI